MSRPPKGNAPTAPVELTLRLTPEMAARLASAAQQRGMQLGDCCRDVLERWLAAVGPRLTTRPPGPSAAEADARNA